MTATLSGILSANVVRDSERGRLAGSFDVMKHQSGRKPFNRHEARTKQRKGRRWERAVWGKGENSADGMTGGKRRSLMAAIGSFLARTDDELRDGGALDCLPRAKKARGGGCQVGSELVWSGLWMFFPIAAAWPVRD